MRRSDHRKEIEEKIESPTRPSNVRGYAAPLKANVGQNEMKHTLQITVCILAAVAAGCSGRSSQVVFRFWFGNHQVSHVAQVRADGSFSNEVRWTDRADIFCGTVRPETGGLYRVSCLHEGRQFVGRDGRYEYNSYTNTQLLRPNVKEVLFAWELQGENRDTTLMLKMK